MFGPPHLVVRRPSPTTVEFIVTTQPRRSGWTGRAVAAAVVLLRLVLAAAAGAVLWTWLDTHWSALTDQYYAGSAHSGPAQAQAHAHPQAHARHPPTTDYRASARAYGRAYGAGGRREDLWQALALDAVDVVAAFVAQIGPALAGLARRASAGPPWLVLPLCVGALWASVTRVHTSESLLVLRGLGIQTRSTGATYLGDVASGLSVVWWTLALPVALVARFFSISRDEVASSTATPGLFGVFGFSLSNYDGYYGEPTPAATRFIPTEKLQDLLVNEAFRGFEVRYYLVAVVVAGRRAGLNVHGPGGGERRGGSTKTKTRRGSHVSEDADEEMEDRHASVDVDVGVDVDVDTTKARRGEYGGDGEYYDSEHDDDTDDDTDDTNNDDNDDDTGDDDEAHVVVVFPRLLPGLDIVRTVWREARACLYEPDKAS